MKRSMTLAMALLLAFTMSVSSFGASVFSDIKDVPWAGAETYIDYAHNIGIMTGDVSGKNRVFRAKAPVTLCESAQIIYNLMKKTGALPTAESYITKWSSVLRVYDIPGWAQESIAFCLENNIITMVDLQDFIYLGKSKEAKREEVALFMGRALVKTGKMGNISAASALSFSDASQIGQQDVPYIAFVVDNGIMLGDGSGRFLPYNNINRAEMAVIVAKGYGKLTGQSVPQAPVSYNPDTGGESVAPGGTIATQSPQSSPVSTQIMQKTGTVRTIQPFGATYMLSVDCDGTLVGLLADSTVPVNYNGAYSGLSALAEGDAVTFKASGGNAISITINTKLGNAPGNTLNNYNNNTNTNTNTTTTESITRDTAKEEKGLAGEITALSASRMTLETANGKEYEYYLISNNSVYIRYNGSTSTYSKLKGYYDDGKHIYASVDLDSSDKVTDINAESFTKKTTSSGGTSFTNELRGDVINFNSRRITIQNNYRQYTYELLDEDDMTIKLDNKSKDLADLLDYYEDRDELYVELSTNSAGKVKRIDAEKNGSSSGSGDYDGKITKINTSSITIKEGSRSNRYNYADKSDLIVKVDGRSSTLSKLIRLFDDDEDLYADITVDRNDEVTRIDADTDYDDDDDYDDDITEGSITALSSRKISLKDGSDKATYTLIDTDDLTVRIDSSTGDYEELKDLFDDDYDLYAKVRLDDDGDVRRIEAKLEDSTTSSELKGYISTLSYYKITLRGGKSYQVEDDDEVDVTIDGKSRDYDKLMDYYEDDEDIYVVISLNSDGTVKKIKASID